jgi:2-polyprenyl-3-methyl-5-hydroxy-6-metoxy-1,4-benzoquinol methylase
LAKHAKRVVGIDIADLSKAEAKARRLASKVDVEFLRSRLQDAPFSDESFDKVFSFCVIEHIPEYREIMQKCFDLLKPGGEFVISVDSLHGIDPELKALHAERHHVVHYFEAPELHAILSECGFGEVHIQGLYRSKYSEKLFSRGILDDFSHTLSATFRRWLTLRITESLSPKSEEGIFLVAKCRK